MVETLGCNNIDRINNLQNDANEFKFDRSLLRVKESVNESLPEGFSYDSDGSIVCENILFEKEDYIKSETPIDKLLLGKMKEGEYRGIDYSGCENKDKIFKAYGSTFLFLTKQDGHVVIDGKEGYPVYLQQGTKIVSPTVKDNFYVNYINYGGGSDIIYKTDVMNIFVYNGITLDDIKSYFGNNAIQQAEIYDLLDFGDDNTFMKNGIKKSLFGEYYDKIERISNVVGILWYKLKQKLGDVTFNQYISKFMENLDNYNGKLEEGLHKERLFSNPDCVGYLLSQKCTVTLDNIDSYISYLNKGCITIPDIGYCTPEEAQFAMNCGFYPMNLDRDKIDRIKNFENDGITQDMIKFANQDFIGDEPNMYRIEGLFGPGKEGKNLYEFLSKYPDTKLKNLGGNEINEISLNIEKRNFCFRGILEMIKCRNDIKVKPYPGDEADDNAIREWKESWERVIQEYEDLLRSYISLDFYVDENGEKKQLEKSQTFDKIFYSVPNEKEDHNGVFAHEYTNEMRKYLEQFSKGNRLEDYSNGVDENGNLNQMKGQKMIKDICEYAGADQHKNEKILVYIGAHGGKDGSSGNGWTKEDWLKISKYSNVTIMTPRCYFGKAFNSEDEGLGDYIYDQNAQLSGFSNRESTYSAINLDINDALDKGLGFHEMQIYSRLSYGTPSDVPLSVKMNYKNWITGEDELKIIGLAYNEDGDVFENVT